MNSFALRFAQNKNLENILSGDVWKDRCLNLIMMNQIFDWMTFAYTCMSIFTQRWREGIVVIIIWWSHTIHFAINMVLIYSPQLEWGVLH